MTKYVALLRGINVGGNKSVKMVDIKQAFESAGCTQVRTLLASGNVVFNHPNITVLTLETTLNSTLNQSIEVVLRPFEAIEALIKANPFKDIVVTPDTRLYVTFLSETPAQPIIETGLDSTIKLIQKWDQEIYSVVTLSPQKNTTDLMKWLEKTYGKKITTRSWNTVLKLANCK